MDDRLVVSTALGAAGAALLVSVGVNPVVASLAPAVAVCFAASLGRERSAAWGGGALAVVVVLAVGLRAAQDTAGLEAPLPDSLVATAELGADPTRSDFGTSVELIVDGRRYLGAFGREVEHVLAGKLSGDRLSITGRTEQLRGAPRGWLMARHLAARVRVDSAESIPGTKPWFRAANGVHELLARGAASMSEAHRSLYLGLVLGDDRGQDDLTRFRFRASGLTHLLAVSGQNLVFVLVALSPLTSRLTHRWRWALGMAAIVAFVLITRAEPSVMRAAVMAALGLTAVASGRSAPRLRILALAVVVLLLADPLLVASIGFRLSVAATLGLLLLTAPIAARLPGPRWLTRPLSVTLAAQLGAAPVSSATFGAVSVLSIPANLLAAPAAGAVMTSGMTSGLLAGLLREDIARWIQLPTRMALWWVETVAVQVAGLSARPVALAGWLALSAAGAAAVMLWRHSGRAALGRCALVLVLPWVVLLRPLTPSPDARTELSPGVRLEAPCGLWELVVDHDLAEREVPGVVEQLWLSGLTRVAVVRAETFDVALEDLAEAMRARIASHDDAPATPALAAPGPGPGGGRGPPCSLGR